MPEITLYQFPAMQGVDSSSPFCTKVHRALALKGLDYRVHNVGNPREIKRLNPRGKVPVLDYNGQRLVDSSRIIAFVDEQHPEQPLLPAAAAARTRALLVEDWADESLYWSCVYYRWQVPESFKRLVQQGMGFLPAPLRLFVPKIIRGGILKALAGQGSGLLSVEEMDARFDEQLALLEGLLAEGPYLAGETLSVADLAAFGPLQGLLCPVTPEQGPRIRNREPIWAWLKRVDAATQGEHTAALPEPS